MSENHLKHHLNANLDSNNNNFNFGTCCIFCGETAKKKDSQVDIVSDSFLQSIKNAMEKRNYDEWAEELSNRISSVSDLIGVKIVYHQNCRIGFRTNKPKPKNKTAPPTFEYKKGFLDVLTMMESNKQKQYSIIELIDKMNLFSNGNAYSFNQMKTNLLKHFGDDIIISTVRNKKSLVTFRSTCYEILDNFYEASNNENEKQLIIKRASDFIFDDIKKVTPNKDFYPSASDISLNEAKKFLPETLLALLSNIITGHNASLKIVTIGQAIVQTAHRENVLSPLQIGLAAQMHHFTGSRFVP